MGARFLKPDPKLYTPRIFLVAAITWTMLGVRNAG